jgi:fatty-acyl-CoA synthase
MIHRWIAAHAAGTPDAPALRFEGRRIPYAALAHDVEARAATLAAQGIGRGDRIAFLGANHPAQIVLLAACARLGAVQVPLNWRLAPPELGYILADSGARAVYATAEMAGLAARAAPPGCVVQDAEARSATATTAPPEAGTPLDPLLLVYTSGTTGRPKGAVLDQRALEANARHGIALHGLTAADRVLTVLPMFHVGGLNIQTTPALMAGAEVLLHPRFEPAAFLAACAADRPSLSLLVPAVMEALVAHPGWAGADLSSLRAIGAGSSEVPIALIEAFHAHGVPVQQVYGATETGPIAIAQTREEALAAPGSIGRPVPGTEARIMGPDGTPRPAGEAGEIEVRGPNLARGYWNAPEATAAAFRPGGWFATGDIAVRDREGRYWFRDRRTHVIISGGENIYPAEVERVLRGAPGVREGVVCGRPDPRWGEVPVAVVVPGPGFDAAAVLRHFDGQLARFKHPRAVVTVEALPRTALGKVQMAAVRRMAAG